ncbi:hypothetical protein FQN57_007519 [Myotisia sp. PD_48]|nr:hypothetical protein FQN57_007519 [Myotisia sp. PD_48]
MAFRRRNIAVPSRTGRPGPPVPSTTSSPPPTKPPPIAGLRPSPIDGRPTTSTGTQTLDSLLAGHAGLAVGSSLLIEESGTTDFAGALLRYYAAEGVVQGQQVHVIGFDSQWAATLPGLIGAADAAEDKSSKGKEDKMKIAWRYERLGGFGVAGSRAPSAPLDTTPGSQQSAQAKAVTTFCHAYDLTKRLSHPSLPSINFIPLQPSTSATTSPFIPIIDQISEGIKRSPPHVAHRIVIPSLLSPAIYPPHASQPHHVLQFMHTLRAFLSLHSSRMTAMISLPLSLYPRSSPVVSWLEMLCDGVVELVPFPHSADNTATSGAATAQEERPQGMLKVHRYPVQYQFGGRADTSIEDWAFTLSRRNIVGATTWKSSSPKLLLGFGRIAQHFAQLDLLRKRGAAGDGL